MTALETLQSVQFVTVNGKRLAVIDAEDWDALVDWLENLEDRRAVCAAIEELAAAGGDRALAGWQKWDSVAGQLE